MPKMELTDTLIRKAAPPSSGRTEYWDTYERGLYIRFYPSRESAAGETAPKVWGLRYRANGRQRRIRIGDYPAMSLQEARKRARAYKVDIDAGKDPQAEKIAARHATAPLTVREAAETFLQHYKRLGRRARTVEQMEWAIRKHLIPLFGSHDLESVTKKELVQALDRMASRKRNSANLIFRLWRVFFNWTVERDYRQISPLMGVKNPLPMKARERWLGKDDESELIYLLKAFDTEPYPYGSLFHLLLLTGQRRNEVATMEWAQVSKERKEWTIPAHVAKNGREHVVPLPDAAWRILEEVPRTSSPLVFTTTGSTPLSGFHKVRYRVAETLDTMRAEDGKEPLEPWTLHDLRRTAASHMARLRVAPHVIEAVLNHVSGQVSGIAAIYNRHTYEGEKREALETWAEYLEHLRRAEAAKSTGANVVPFEKRGA